MRRAVRDGSGARAAASLRDARVAPLHRPDYDVVTRSDAGAAMSVLSAHLATLAGDEPRIR
ncbi:hypothetical protein GCM10009559_78900 [Pseudonocardia zijingensis]|uniref:Uncharacterized protein n=1 Tax=Pseudonocardia zijingensis TaxID=153376 RepID=A0ABP3YZH6_9PSEU